MAKKTGPVSSRARQASRGTASIDEIAAEVNKEHGAGTMLRASQAKGLVAGRALHIPTGSLAYDLALGGGLPVNKWTEAVGRESAGKTTFAFKAIAKNQASNPEFTALWNAAEDFDYLRAEQCGVDLDRIMLLEENVMEIVYEKIVDAVRRRAVDMAVIDSAPQLITFVEDEDAPGGQKIPPGAKLTNSFMRQVNKATKRSLVDPGDRPFTGLFINQWRSKVGVVFGDPRTTPLGEGKNYMFWARVEISRDDWIRENDRLLGQSIALNVFKNKQAPPREAAVADYYFRDRGPIRAGDYDTGGELLNLGLMFDVVEKAGSTYRYDGASFRSKAAFTASVLGEPALFARIEEEIRASAHRRENPRAAVTPVLEVVGGRKSGTGGTRVPRRNRGA